jgi:hypothetical protein
MDGGNDVADVYCAYESAKFASELFEPYEGGPLLEHLKVKVRHTNNGLEIGGGSGPAPEAEGRGGGGGGGGGGIYGRGPMAPRDDIP